MLNKRINKDGIKKYVVRAKYEIDEALTDFYIETSGAISDNITKSNDAKIVSEILYKAENNKNLLNKISEYVKGDLYEEKSLQKIANFNDVSAWSSFVSGV